MSNETGVLKREIYFVTYTYNFHSAPYQLTENIF